MSSAEANNSDNNEISHVLNKDKKYLSEHGQKLFNAINCLLDDQEQLELTQALFKYQREHNVFTLVRSCRELFDTPRKKSLMLFMRPVIPMRDRFHYDEYYKLFFPEEFPANITSIFKDLIPQDLLEKTLKKADEKKKQNLDKEKEKEQTERIETIKILEKANYDLNLDIQKLMSQASLVTDSILSDDEDAGAKSGPKSEKKVETPPQQGAVKIAGFRIIDLNPDENESLGFDICLGPTGTFIMISYVEPNSQVEKLGMKAGDELVSVNEISFKMIELEQAIEILSTEPTLRIVLQTSGFMPSDVPDSQSAGSSQSQSVEGQWVDTFNRASKPPAESKSALKLHLRRIHLRPRQTDTGLGFRIRGGIEYSLGVFISYVEPQSHADMIGLRVSDQIIEVNGQTFARISRQEAELILKSSLINYIHNRLPIKITVRYLGRLPVLKTEDTITNIDRNKIHEFKNDLVIRRLFPTDSSPKAYELFKYILKEYANNRIDITYFLYLVSNKLKSHKNLIAHECVSTIVNKNNDGNIYKKFLETNHLNTNNLKNSLIMRSSEVLNDLNVNTSLKVNKYDSSVYNSGLEQIKNKKNSQEYG